MLVGTIPCTYRYRSIHPLAWNLVDENVPRLSVRVESVKRNRELESLSSTSTDYSNILDLDNGAFGQHHISWLSEYAWFPYSDNLYLLSCFNDEVLRVQLMQKISPEAGNVKLYCMLYYSDY